MEAQTLVALVGVGGAVIGSAIGGAISFVSSRAVRKMDWQLSIKEKEIQNRESQYIAFLTEANRLMLKAFDGKIGETTELTKLAALEAALWFFSDKVGQEARKLTRSVMNRHEQRPEEEGPSFAELRDAYIAECKRDVENIKRKPL